MPSWQATTGNQYKPEMQCKKSVQIRYIAQEIRTNKKCSAGNPYKPDMQEIFTNQNCSAGNPNKPEMQRRKSSSNQTEIPVDPVERWP